MYQNIIKEISEELGLKIHFLSNNWLIMLEKDNQIRYITGYKFDLNSQSSSLSIDDKYAMYEILKNKNIPVITHHLMYSQSNNEPYAKDYKDKSLAHKYFKKYHSNIVIKNNTGTCGHGVYHITDEKEIDITLDKTFKKAHSISICPFYNIIDEYRIIILNNHVKLIYKKDRPIIYGDGIHTISYLLKEFNPNYQYKILDDYILPKDKEYMYTWLHNLSNGTKINLEVPNKEYLINFAKEVANILNIKFGSIDIINTPSGYLVLECNSGVMMNNLINQLPNGKTIAKDIYKEAIKLMFQEYNQ